MKITLDIQDAKASLVVDAICSTQGYNETIVNEAGEIIANPETRQAFAKRMIILHIKSLVAMYERQQAERSFLPTEITIT